MNTKLLNNVNKARVGKQLAESTPVVGMLPLASDGMAYLDEVAASYSEAARSSRRHQLLAAERLRNKRQRQA